MEEITVVRKRTQIWPILLTLLLLTLIVLAVVWMMGSSSSVDISWNQLTHLGRSHIHGIT